MERIAKFEKVSFEQFKKDWKDTFINSYTRKCEYPESQIELIYEQIELPTRATTGSAGYDFKAPIDITLMPNETIKIPTGIRVYIKNGWVLQCYPRSGLGFKYRLQIDNTVPIIDSDYYYSNNEGHIFIKITNDSRASKILKVNAGDGFVQGIFVQYGITTDDNVTDIRNGGLGSTSK